MRSNTNRVLLSLILGSSILYSISLGIFLEIGLSITIHSEVRKYGLISNRLSFSNIGHLNRFFSELPLIPAVIGIDILLDKVYRCLDTLIDHELVFYSAFNSLIY